MDDALNLVLLYVEPVLVLSLLYVVVVINLSKDRKLRNHFYALYTWTALSIFLFHVGMFYKHFAMRYQFVEFYPMMAKISIYLQNAGFFSISIGTILITLNRYCAVGKPTKHAQIWSGRNVYIMLLLQHVIGYGHCVQVLFTEVVFLPMGTEKFIALGNDVAILTNLSSAIISVVVIVICTPMSIMSALLLRVKKYQFAERSLVYTSIFTFLVHGLCCLTKVAIYIGRFDGYRHWAAIGLSTLHYLMELNVLFNIAMPLVSHRSLRKSVFSPLLSISDVHQIDKRSHVPSASCAINQYMRNDKLSAITVSPALSRFSARSGTIIGVRYCNRHV